MFSHSILSMCSLYSFQVSMSAAAARCPALCPSSRFVSVVRFIVYGYIISQAGHVVKPFLKKICPANNFFLPYIDRQKLGRPSGQMVETGNARPLPLLPSLHNPFFHFASFSSFSCSLTSLPFFLLVPFSPASLRFPRSLLSPSFLPSPLRSLLPKI